MRKYALLLIVAFAGGMLLSKIEARPALPEVLEKVDTFERAFVTRVIDGDTIEVYMGNPSKKEIVRYVGMDAPETVDPRKPVQCFGKEAAEENRRLVEGKPVLLERDVTDRDKYGRLLRYVYLKDEASSSAGTFANLILVAEGYARTFPFPPDVIHNDVLAAAEAEAKFEGLGLWKACASA